ncbi:hypothetical protein G6F57_013857 [Rhizopus arrhizus]|uniref:Uncharacterized protein n=1 Tax=Rhizopus oryzae TaxID=64495 RepID=A0A9P7BM40_RHIOR|nr:hypothetical protein G6F23_010419 [Rhizopus arrhizus]KAG1399520.1 hypothetical protein G6F58_011121 [Rhizopus delemar]KAG0754612.1 hypothetical protein G6F24_012361 [Rhizopus arrhizus]KAG0779949.1 hypothetical protein G6F21_012360 [Rhizopus arrhizus]KAG0781899.1 hypothetical protein G6F22_009352 [Rhizopus arrhizus]
MPDSILVDITHVDNTTVFYDEFTALCKHREHLWVLEGKLRVDGHRCFAEFVVPSKERHLAVEQKRRNITLVVKNSDGVYITPTDDKAKNPVDEKPSLGIKSEIKHESQQYDGTMSLF